MKSMCKFLIAIFLIVYGVTSSSSAQIESLKAEEVKQLIQSFKELPRDHEKGLLKDITSYIFKLGEGYEQWNEMPTDIMACISLLEFVSEQFYYHTFHIDLLVSDRTPHCRANQDALYDMLTIRYCTVKESIKSSREKIEIISKRTESKKTRDLLQKSIKTITNIISVIDSHQEILRKITNQKEPCCS